MTATSSDTPQARLAALGLALPVPAAPVANYVAWTRAGNLIFVSGQLPIGPGGAIEAAHKGKLGAGVSVEAGQAAAASGDLASLRAVRLGGFINSAPDFGALPQVLNGASDLIAAVLGEAGRHARFAVGVAQLPLDAAVEVEGIFEIVGG